MRAYPQTLSAFSILTLVHICHIHNGLSLSLSFLALPPRGVRPVGDTTSPTCAALRRDTTPRRHSCDVVSPLAFSCFSFFLSFLACPNKKATTAV